jgi:Tfp pilus assembly protein PilX
MTTRANTILRAQSGAALVISLIMIIVLTLIALASSYTSIFEIKISGIKRGSTTAFYAACTGINEITTNTANFDLNNYNAQTNTYTPFSDKNNTTPNPTNVVATITYLPAQAGPPRGTGFSAVNLNYVYYQVQSLGQDQNSPFYPASKTTIQEEMVRLLPVQ